MTYSSGSFKDCIYPMYLLILAETYDKNEIIFHLSFQTSLLIKKEKSVFKYDLKVSTVLTDCFCWVKVNNDFLF